MSDEYTIPPAPPPSAALDLRHRRLHVVHEGAQYTVYVRQQLKDVGHRYPLGIWRTIEHVIDDGSDSYLGSEILIPRERIAFAVDITSADFDAAKHRTEV